MKQTIIGFFLAAVSLTAFGQSYTPVDKDSKVHFVIKNLGIPTGGDFTGLAGSIKFDPKNLAASEFDVSVDASTVDTDIASRDNHLKRTEYFNVKKYPTLNFKSTKITTSNNKDFLYVFGKLTIKGVTKEVKFPFKATAKDGGWLFEGNFRIDRKDFGVGGNSISLSDEVAVSLSIFAK